MTHDLKAKVKELEAQNAVMREALESNESYFHHILGEEACYGVGGSPMTTKYHLEKTKQALSLAPSDAVEMVKDAKRFRYLMDEHSWHYGTRQDSPMECGIAFGVQELSPDRQGWDIIQYIDEAIEAARAAGAEV